jgi:membrane protein required for colicin V production
MRLAAAYVLVFVGVLLGFALARLLISLMLKAVGLGLLDRLLGGAFGVVRGMLVVVLCGAGGGHDALAQVRLVAQAVLAPPLETAVIAAKPWLPRKRRNGFGFDRGRPCAEFWVWSQPRR